ncbi:MAG: flagellar biosynthesis anti-sigma factor FlgM [Candidatus Hydrogenedentes bacterium]|nr:flagellar biosynthesis anti-sigma factor FlgM [Candidatus Hydrogenedentota bacterium]
MVGIQGLGGIPEPKSGGPAKVRSERESETRTLNSTTASNSSEDNVSISSEAQVAAEVARLVQATRTEADVRADRVEAARARIEQGSYKDPEVVGQMADKILKYLG